MLVDILKKRSQINIKIFDSTDENKDLLKRYNDVFNGLIDKIKNIDDD